MKTMNLSDFSTVLEKAAKQKGEAGVIAQKALVLENYMIVDEAGMAVDPSSLDVVIKAAAPAAAPEIEADAASAEEIAKSVRKNLAQEVLAHKFHVRAEMGKDWEKARVFGRLKNLKTTESAYKFGRWALGALGHVKSAEWCKSNGLPLIRMKGHIEGINSQGGFAVPEEFESELITLREQYGVFRRNARVVAMGSDVKRLPKRASTVTAYFVGEAQAITESQQSLDQVQLVAKKLGVLTTISSELNEDNVVGLGDDLAGEIAYAFALKEDDCGFNGDGTSTYGGIVGLANALTDATYQVSDGGATTYAAVTQPEISAALRKLPAWAAQRNNIKVFCSKNAYHGVFERLAMGVGGVTATEIANGLSNPRFFGYPVEFAQVIPVTESGGATFAYIGDLAQACIFGDRRQQTVAFSDSALNAFEQDELAVRGTQRFDIVCANVGSSSAYGAMVKLTL
jgi:HK97 family phage major capsid protein